MCAEGLNNGAECQPFKALTNVYCYPFPGFIVSSVLRKGVLQYLCFSITVLLDPMNCHVVRCLCILRGELLDVIPSTDSRTGNL